MRILIFILISVSCFSQSFVKTDLTTTPKTLIYDGIVSYTKSVIQVHRMADITPTSTDFESVKFDTLIANETTLYFEFNDDSTGIVYTGVDGCIIRLQGCFHTNWTGAGGTSVTVLGRVLVNDIEARCSQVNWRRTRQTSDETKLDVIGTIYMNYNDTLYMQYDVSNTDMHFIGSAGFDYPVAASINLECISKDN